MKKRAWIMAGMLMAGLLTGCSGGGTETTEADATAAVTAESTGETETEAQEGENTETESEAADQEPVTILAAAAASLEYSFSEQLIPMFQEQYPWITVEGTYDSSGKLQTQIEEGLDADIFMSAATKQMDALNEEGLVVEESVTDLLENKIVLIVPAGSEGTITSFEEIGNASAIALGDPASVPVGQYSQESLTNLGIWDQIQDKVSFGTNVTEVLNWVAEGSADAGIVYSTDAATTDRVTVVAEAPEGSLAEPDIYPVAVVSASTKQEAANLFLEFLKSDEALAVFESYGFAAR